MTTGDQKEEKASRRIKPMLVVTGVLCVALGLAVLRLMNPRDKGQNAEVPLFTVNRALLTIDIVESGSLQNKDQVVIKNKVGKATTISFVLPEGSLVKEGDLIIELDSTELEESRLTKSVELMNGESALIQATETLAIVKNQSQSDIDKAELDKRFAVLELKKYTEGLYPQSVEKAESDIMIAEEDLQRASDAHDWSRQLHEKGFITRTELQADELSTKRKRITLKLAKGDFDLLKRYTHPQQLEKLEADVKRFGMAFERAQRKAKADVVKAEATLRAKDSEVSIRKRRLEKAEDDVRHCRMTAPGAGMVVYATSGGGRRRNSQEPIEVGARVQFRQELIHMPRSDEMMASFSVPEATRPKLHEGMDALVRVPALPGLVFPGKLTKLGILPDSTQSWLNPDLKVYRCEVVLDEPNARMRPGMNCQIEILVEEYADALFVPIQCVLQVDEKPTVFIQREKKIEQRPIETGLDNNIMIHVLDGLAEGDEIMLAPPLDAAAKGGNGGPSADHAKPTGDGA